MATLTIRMPDEKADRLKMLAQQRGVSVNKLIEEWATMGIAEFDIHASFLARAARGSRDSGLLLLDQLDALDSGAGDRSDLLHDSAKDQGGFLHKED